MASHTVSHPKMAFLVALQGRCAALRYGWSQTRPGICGCAASGPVVTPQTPHRIGWASTVLALGYQVFVTGIFLAQTVTVCYFGSLRDPSLLLKNILQYCCAKQFLCRIGFYGVYRVLFLHSKLLVNYACNVRKYFVRHAQLYDSPIAHLIFLASDLVFYKLRNLLD